MYVSAFELYRIGPGPSSACTVGPQRAALRFVHDLAADGLTGVTARVEAELYGGLAFHGREHSSDRAIVAGLSGLLPERCDSAALALCLDRATAERSLPLGGRRRVGFDPAHDLRLVVNHSLAYDGNAMRFLARNARGEIVASRIYFSSGGGTVLADDDASRGAPMPRVPYPYRTADALLAACQSHGKKIPDLVRANECAFFARAKCAPACSSSRRRCARRSNAASPRKACCGAATSGRRQRGRWPRARPGPRPRNWPRSTRPQRPRRTRLADAWCPHRPAGSVGPVAALLQLWNDSAPFGHDDGVVDFLLAGAAIGALLRAAGVQHVGCQSEVGVAAAMAAAGYAAVQDGSNAQVMYAAERALAPHLGLACDPVGGRIEEPCIERNAVAASRAAQAALEAVRTPAPRNGIEMPRSAR